jgi:transcriptional regulator with XRE-family HTH domain
MEKLDEATETLYFRLGQTIKMAREAQGLTQQQLAGALKLTRGALNHIEEGTKVRRIPLHMLYAAAAALNLSPHELLPVNGYPSVRKDADPEYPPELPEGLSGEARRWINAVAAAPDRLLGRDCKQPKVEPLLTGDYPEDLLRLVRVNRPPVPVDAIAAKLGHEVVYLPFEGYLYEGVGRGGAPTISGIAYIKGLDQPTRIGINSLLPRTRQRLTLACLLQANAISLQIVSDIHFFNGVGDNSSTPVSFADEYVVDRAMSLLMPLRMLKEDLRGMALDLDDAGLINQLAVRYQVSPSLAAVWLTRNFFRPPGR